MSLPRLRLEKCVREGTDWLIDKDEAHHLVKVRRCYSGAVVEGLLNGEKISLRLICDGDTLRAQEISRTLELPVYPEIHLLLAVLKNEQMDLALRFSSEIGVSVIHLLSCERSVPKYEEQKLDDKMRRWNKILDESTKQSGSALPPVLLPQEDLSNFDFSCLPKDRYAALISDDARALCEVSLPVPSSVALAIGPEGDWSCFESNTLLDNGFVPISLGKRILRASTAVAVMCSWFVMSSHKD